MTAVASRFHFASAPDSWGVLDYPGPSWEQSYQKMLDEMVHAGYTGTELGPYGFFPTDPKILKVELAKRHLRLLGSFVPVTLSDPASTKVVIEQVRKVGNLLATLGAPFLVLADAQSTERDQIAGRVPSDGSAGLNAQQWKQVARVVADAAQVTAEYGLDLVFHPHISTYVETPRGNGALLRRNLIDQDRPLSRHGALRLRRRRSSRRSREVSCNSEIRSP